MNCGGHEEEVGGGQNECLCNVRCEGVATHDEASRRREEYALGIKYYPGIAPILPRYTYVEYKARSSTEKFTIFKKCTTPTEV